MQLAPTLVSVESPQADWTPAIGAVRATPESAPFTPPVVSDEQLAAVARYLEAMGVPELAREYFPRDTHRIERVLLAGGILCWVVAIISVLLVIGDYGTPAYGTHSTRWNIWIAALVMFGAGTLLMREELRSSRTGLRPSRPTKVRVVLRGVEVLLWIGLIAVFLDPTDPGAVALELVLIAGLLYRCVLKSFAGRHLATLGVATVRAAIDGAIESPRIASTVPLMLGVVAFLFISGDAWRLFGRMEDWRFWTLSGALGLVVIAGLRSRLPKPMEDISRWDAEAFARNVASTPAAALAQAGVTPLLDMSALSRWSRVSLVSRIWTARAVRIMASAAALSVILLAIGLLSIGRDQTADLVGTKLVNMVPYRIGGIELDLSDSLTKVAILLSLIGAAYFVVVSLADVNVQKRYLYIEEGHRASQVLAVWAYYTGALAARTPYLSVWGKPVYRRDLRGVDLRGADLSAARLDGIDLRGARANRQTKWPHEFDPRGSGVSIH